MKGKKDMSDTNVTVVEGVAKRRVFDLDKFERVTVEVKYSVPAPLTDVSQVSSIPAEQLLKVVNAGLKRQALLDAKASIKGTSPKIVNQMVNAWRFLPPYSDLVKKDANGDVTAESRKAQTQAIFAFIKSQPAILDALKAASLAATDEDDEEENETEG